MAKHKKHSLKNNNYNVNDPVIVAVRKEMIRRLVERNKDFKIDWLAEKGEIIKPKPSENNSHS